MSIKAGGIVYINHYSGMNPFLTIVLEAMDNTLKLKLTKEFAISNFLEGDPVVLGFELNKEVYIASCYIVLLDLKEGIVILKIENFESVTNKRESERYYVSLFSEIIGTTQDKIDIGIVKNISIGGLMLSSKTEFQLNQILSLNIYLEDSTLAVKTEVVRKKQGYFLFDYGLKITSVDIQTRNNLKKYLKFLKEKQGNLIIGLKNSKL